MEDGVTTLYVGSHYQVSGGVVTKYYFAGSQIIAERKSGALSFILADHLGSTGVVTDAAGAVISETRYTPYGETRLSSGTSPTDYMYTSQRQEAGLGLYFYNARWYDPALARFNQPDTLVSNTASTQNYDRYAYVLGNPLRYTDPTGHDAFGDFFAGFVTEAIRTVVWFAPPPIQTMLVPSNSESEAMLAGRVLADVASIGFGLSMISGGIGTAGGGTIASCGLAVCATVPAAITVGAAEVLQGAGMSVKGAIGLGENLVMLSKKTNKPLKPYDVGPSDELYERSQPGDNLQVHHAPQGKPAGQVIRGYDYKKGPGIALPDTEHQTIPNLKGPYQGSPRNLTTITVRNLRNYTKAPNSSLWNLIDLIKNMFGGLRK